MAELGSVSAVVRTSRVRSLLDRCPLQVASGPSRRWMVRSGWRRAKV